TGARPLAAVVGGDAEGDRATAQPEGRDGAPVGFGARADAAAAVAVVPQGVDPRAPLPAERAIDAGVGAPGDRRGAGLVMVSPQPAAGVDDDGAGELIAEPQVGGGLDREHVEDRVAVEGRVEVLEGGLEG